MKTDRFALRLAVCAVALAHLPAYADNYFFKLMPSFSVATDVNNAGQVTGDSSFGTVWSPGGGQRVYTDTALYSINSSGTAAGALYLDYGKNITAAITVKNGTATVLSGFGGGHDVAIGINDAGDTVGMSRLVPRPGAPSYVSGDVHAVNWHNGVATDLGTLGGSVYSRATAINNSGLIVGESFVGNTNQLHATAWVNGKIIDLTPGVGITSSAVAVNDNNTIVGVSRNSHATKWENGQEIDLGTLLGPNSTYKYNYSYANAINNKGQIVGFSSIDSYYTGTVATLWDNGQVIDLNKYISPQASADGWILQNAVGINEDGWIVGRAYRYADDKLAAFILSTRDFGAATPVPEPSSYAMLLAGLGLMGWTMRRKQGKLK